jgi:hypothetical protein
VGSHVFLSYAREDKDYVERLRAHLESRGLDTWVDTETDYGTRWTQVVREKVDGCVALVVVMTPDAEASEWVDREIHRAETLGKLIVPLLLRGQSFFRLGVTQYVDVTGGQLPPDDVVRRLASAGANADAARAGAEPAAAPSESFPPPPAPPAAPPSAIAQTAAPDRAASSPEAAPPASAPAGVGQIELDIIWPGASGFAADARIEIELDGERIATGSFLEGFQATVHCVPGLHTLTTSTTAMAVITRRRSYPVELRAGAYSIVLRYSRFWGNFTKELAIHNR